MKSTRRALLKAGSTVAGAPALGRAGAALLSPSLRPVTGLAAAPLLASAARAQGTDTLTIAYNVALPSWDPTTGPSSVNPTLQSIWKAVFDQYIDQNPDLSFKPGLFTEWGWNPDKTEVFMTLREGATWHDGKPVTAADIIWNLERAADPQAGNPVGAIIWASIGNLKADGRRITGQVRQYVADLFKWMAFLTGYAIAPHHYRAVGAAGFEKQPVGSGPYKVVEFVQGSFVRLAAHDGYWGEKPAFANVLIKFVTDPSARVAEIESGKSDLTLAVPFEEFDRLKALPALTGVSNPISDIAMIFINDVAPLTDANVRRAIVHAIDKELIVKRLLKGYGRVIDTLQTPEYAAFDPSIRVRHDPALARELLGKSGFGPDNPVKLKIQTTRGYLPKDYEAVQALVGMWRKVGIAVEIETYEIAKHYELRMSDRLAPLAFYNWGNAIGDPNDSTGFAMFGPSPHSAWKASDLDAMIGPLWGEKDEARRIAGWRKVDAFIADHALVLPLYQQVQPVLHRKSIRFTPHTAGFVLPQAVKKA